MDNDTPLLRLTWGSLNYFCYVKMLSILSGGFIGDASS